MVCHQSSFKSTSAAESEHLWAVMHGFEEVGSTDGTLGQVATVVSPHLSTLNTVLFSMMRATQQSSELLALQPFMLPGH